MNGAIIFCKFTGIYQKLVLYALYFFTVYGYCR